MSLRLDAKVYRFLRFLCRHLKPLEPGRPDGGGVNLYHQLIYYKLNMHENLLNRKNLGKGLSIKRKPLLVVLSTILYVSLVIFLPWDQISRTASLEGGFRDFGRYVQIFSYRHIPLRELYGWTSLLQYFTGEALWDELMLKLVSITGDPVISLRIISCFICSIWGIYAFSKVPFFWALTFLLNPISIEVALSGIRNGFAWSIFILATMIGFPLVRYLLFAMIPFIHSSAIILILFFSYSQSPLTLRKLGFFLKKGRLHHILLASLPGISAGIVLVFGNTLLNFLDDRRIDSGGDYFRGGGSFLQMSFWIILFAIQLRCDNDYIRRHNIAINLLAWYIIMNPVIPWSFRIWGAAIPLLAYAVWDLPKKLRNFIIPLWIGYLVMWYFYWSILSKSFL